MKSPEEYYESLDKWNDGCLTIHRLMVDAGFGSSIKWGRPVFDYGGANLIGLSVHQNYMTLMLFQGATLSDPDNVLINAQEGKTKAMRQWRFSEPEVISPALIVKYLEEIKKNQDEGIFISKEKAVDVDLPEELAEAFSKDEQLKEAFDQLSPSKQREYKEHISEAKRDSTKLSRLDKIIPMIKRGEGLHDKYR